jgi:hypothetical protein
MIVVSLGLRPSIVIVYAFNKGYLILPFTLKHSWKAAIFVEANMLDDVIWTGILDELIVDWIILIDGIQVKPQFRFGLANRRDKQTQRI